MTYWKWMLKSGWKSYLLWFLVILFCDFSLFRSINCMADLLTLGIILPAIPLLSATFGIIIHSIIIWKKNRTPEDNQTSI